MNRIIALDPDQVHEYVPKTARDWPDEDQPVFLLKCLKAKESAKLQDNVVQAGMGDDPQMKIFTGSTVLRALEMGLVGWRNFKGKDGTEAEWRENNGKPRPENFDRIPEKIRQELAGAITDGTFLTEQEEKNSESQSHPTSMELNADRALTETATEASE